MYARQQEKREYYLRNRQRIIEYNKQYYKEHIDDKLAYQSQREREEAVIKKKKEYYEKNRDKILTRQRNNKATLQKQNEKQKVKSKKNVAELADEYIVSLIARKGQRKYVAENKNLIETKRAIVLLKREIREHDKK